MLQTSLQSSYQYGQALLVLASPVQLRQRLHLQTFALQGKGLLTPKARGKLSNWSRVGSSCRGHSVQQK